MSNTVIFNEDFQSLLPDGSDGWLIKKGTKASIIEDDKERGLLCEYIDYSFYCDHEYVSS